MDHSTELTADQLIEAMAGYRWAQRGLPCPPNVSQLFADGFSLFVALHG